MKITVTITPTWTKTGEFKNKWYLVPIEFPDINSLASIYKRPAWFDWYIDPIGCIDTIEGTAPTLNAAKQAIRRAMKKAGMIE